ncbi:Imm50 family immunity protein [Streptomyces europaeiscabiei]|uniref:Imm50 family immunity protein n=1 Tax=Streptomyces anulatus TaxID=1892 RepID=UPI00099B7772
MSASNWFQFLYDSQPFRQLYDEPPNLDRCDLFHFLADEREDSITLGFRTDELPTRARPEWEGAEYNTFTFYLVFSGVQELTVEGWAAPAQKRISVGRHSNDGLTITVTSDGTSVAFRSRAMSFTGARVGLVSRSE